MTGESTCARASLTPSWLGIAVIALTLSGCGTFSSMLPSISLPRIFGSDSKKLGPLPDVGASAMGKVLWQTSIGKAGPGLAPAIAGDAVYVASFEGNLARIDANTGRIAWRMNTGKRITAGVGADATMAVVGNDKGEVDAFSSDGAPLWQVRVSSEVTAPPVVGEGMVAVWSGDGRIYGLNASDGKTKWVHQRTNPPLMVRSAASGALARGGVFTGTPGGKLLAIDLKTGAIGWESSVATPKGATELERIADVTSLPVVDERQACAVAYQGRIACFELARGVLEWSRDISSLTGIAADTRYYYVTDDRGSIHALDKSTGASVWKQDRLSKRRIGGPQIVGDQLGVVDAEGYLHLLDRNEGTLLGRLPSDGSAPTAQPSRRENAAIWQTEAGNVYAVTAP
ncbi:MAG: outer membrane protein assembly factor BamB [Pseudomonadota bacterium]|nr:outer membrane protein assembly factor BamB [Pseudomonadota bacterium]